MSKKKKRPRMFSVVFYTKWPSCQHQGYTKRKKEKKRKSTISLTPWHSPFSQITLLHSTLPMASWFATRTIISPFGTLVAAFSASILSARIAHDLLFFLSFFLSLDPEWTALDELGGAVSTIHSVDPAEEGAPPKTFPRTVPAGPGSSSDRTSHLRQNLAAKEKGKKNGRYRKLDRVSVNTGCGEFGRPDWEYGCSTKAVASNDYRRL